MYRLLKIFSICIICFLSCKQNTNNDNNSFNLKEDYTNFAKEMRNDDTLNITALPIVCTGRGIDLLQITKERDSVFIQLKKKIDFDDKFEIFPKVFYKFNQDTLNLEKSFQEFISISNSNELPLFIITTPKEKDTIFLTINGVSERIKKIESYNLLMYQLYPKETRAYNEKHFTTPPPPENYKIH